MYDFANILFSGPCNARCPFCIGRQLDPGLNEPNLDCYPPRNLEALIEKVWQHAIRQVVFTGSNTDPQLYRHEERLLACLRQQLPPGTQYALHTNGRLAVKKMAIFNQYDRVTISLPTFSPATYRVMMGRPDPPDLKALLAGATVPVKISCVVTARNRAETPAFLERCAALGIRRIVLRKLYGDPRPWPIVLPWDELDLAQTGAYRGNPIYTVRGMEVTLWDFQGTRSTSINLFSSGLLSDQYLLNRARSAEDSPLIPELPIQP